MGYAAKLGSSDSKKLNRINLGTSNSINISTHEVLSPIYNKLTIDNFGYIEIGASTTFKYTGTSNGSININKVPTLSYNATTGILTGTNGNIYIYNPGAGVTVNLAFGSTKYCWYVD